MCSLCSCACSLIKWVLSLVGIVLIAVAFVAGAYILGPVVSKDKNTTVKPNVAVYAHYTDGAVTEGLRAVKMDYELRGTRAKRHHDAHQLVDFQPGDKVKLFHAGSRFGWKRGSFSGPHEVLRKLNDQKYLVRYPVRGRMEDKPVLARYLEPYHAAQP